MTNDTDSKPQATLLSAKVTSFFSLLDNRSPGVFLALLVVIRLPIVYALGCIEIRLANLVSSDIDVTLEISVVTTLLLLFVAAPLGETAIECVVPYTIMVGRKAVRPSHPWSFIFVSAGLMTLLHIPVYGLSFLFFVPGALVTGLFLAYCYAHFAWRSQARAFAYTSLFHALINVPGFVLYDLID